MPPIIKKQPKKNARMKREEKARTCLYKNIDRPAETALYYGFSVFEPPIIAKEDSHRARAIAEPELRDKESEGALKPFSVEEKTALMRMYHEKNMENGPQPVMAYFGKPITPDETGGKNSDKTDSGSENSIPRSAGGKPKYRLISLEIMGAPKSIAEAILIKTALEILKTEGFNDLSVHLNSLGDRETISRFSRELTAYYRKNIDDLPTHCRQLMKKDIFSLLACQNEKCRLIRDNAPKSISFLSEQSRDHFKEVLEYLEILEIPYEIDHFLVANRAFSCQTVFEIHDVESREKCRPLAVGVRYCNIARRLGYKRDVPGIGVHLSFKSGRARKNIRFLKPKFYFIQLGFEAKLKSLKIIEALHKEKIPMYQAISRDKLSSQLGMAENMKIPYTVIMGQKEALEDTVIVRHMTDRCQETVKIAELAKYLKKL